MPYFDYYHKIPNTGGALRDGLSQHYQAENQCEPVPNTGGALRDGLSQHYQAENQCEPVPNTPYWT
ncbi:MAG: hypothetical protein F6J90_11665 [Moorea sp. SIOASIH]|nr:hypothetical protein [Moorena sp. SIOASIH]